MAWKSGNWGAVLTGDIVKSSKLSEPNRKRVGEIVQNATLEAQKAFGKKVIPYSSNVFRGDSWQSFVANPTVGPRVAIFLRAHFRTLSEEMNLDVRISVGIGPVESVPGSRVTEGMGRAFELSGQGLDKMKSHRRLACLVNLDQEAEGLAAVMSLVDTISQRWTPKQALAVSLALQDFVQMDIARRWPGEISQQAVARHLRSAGWFGLLDGIVFMESVLGRVFTL